MEKVIFDEWPCHVVNVRGFGWVSVKAGNGHFSIGIVDSKVAYGDCKCSHRVESPRGAIIKYEIRFEAHFDGSTHPAPS